MELTKIPFLDHHRRFLDRFISICQSDERVVAAFLSGSYANGTSDPYSDVDLDLIVIDAAYEEVCAEKKAFLSQLGELVFAEDWGKQHIIFFAFSDDTEGEMMIGSASRLELLHRGPHMVLLDKAGILAGLDFPYEAADSTEQIELLRSIINGFWHDASHFITAMARGQLWWAYGQLEILRAMCVQIARLRNNFLDEEVSQEVFFKIDKVLRPEHLTPLEKSYCTMEPHAMLQAGQIIIQFYQENARALAQTYHIPYPHILEGLMLRRLEKLNDKPMA